MGVPQLLLLALSVALGGATQRVTGLGFALVASPLLVLVAGGFQGVLLANTLSLLTNLAVLAMTWRDVEVRRALKLGLPALGAAPFGAWAAGALPEPVLMVVIGSLVLVALAVVTRAGELAFLRGTPGAVGAGMASGLMNASAGVAGPALMVYAVSTRWPHRSFVASMQLTCALINVGSISAKGLPTLSAWQLIVTLLALPTGLLVGQLMAPRLPAARGRQAVLGLAVCGAMATVAKGIAGL